MLELYLLHSSSIFMRALTTKDTQSVTRRGICPFSLLTRVTAKRSELCSNCGWILLLFVLHFPIIGRASFHCVYQMSEEGTRTMKPSAPLAVVAGLTLALSTTGCTDPSVSATMKSIDSIGTVSIESKEAIDSANKQYDSLDKELKKEVENYDELKSANKRYDQLLYSEITKEISHSQEILSSYFAQQFDTKEIEATKTDAQAALDASDTDGYYKVYKALKKADKELDTYIKDEKKKSYSMETYGGDNPFRLEESDLPSEWSFKPITLQSSAHPSWVMSEKKATNLPTYIYFFINQSSREYTYQLNQIPTKAIKVQNEDGKMQTALVNTEVQFTGQFDQVVNVDPNKELNERPAYFFARAKDNAIVLALQNYDGEDYYVLYTSGS